MVRFTEKCMNFKSDYWGLFYHSGEFETPELPKITTHNYTYCSYLAFLLEASQPYYACWNYAVLGSVSNGVINLIRFDGQME
jgi:hypothetical protein